MKKTSKTDFANKKLIIFDLDGTLTKSKAPMDAKIAGLLNKLLERKMVAVIGGGRYKQFQDQFIQKLKTPKSLLKHLFLFPTTSMAFYRFTNGKWHLVYAHYLSAAQKKKLMKVFHIAFKKHGYKPPVKPYGEIIEDRGSQITFSAIGQDPPKSKKGYAEYLAGKERWNREQDIRPQMMKTMRKYLRGFEIKRGGLTSIDVTKKGIDKAYGVRQIKKALRIQIKDMLFVGDAIYPGGNDYAAIKTGVDYVKVSGPEQTSKIIKSLIEK